MVAPKADGPLFREITEVSGVAFVHTVVPGGRFSLPEIMGSGLAVFDADGDGRLDLYFVDAGTTRGHGAPNRLYRQGEDGRFGEVEHSGAEDAGYGMGVAVGDVDGDGDPDLYVGNWGPDALYLNRGGGMFEEATARSGIAGDAWTSSVAMLDYDLDGWLDLWVVHYVDVDPGKQCLGAQGRDDYCSPNVFDGVADTLYRNRGDGTFEDVSLRAGIAGAPANGLGVIVDDFDGDGWPDVYVANDGEANQLWLNQRDGTFVDEGLLAGAAVNSEGAAEASMGVVAGDVDGDGMTDLFMTHLANETNTLYLGRPGGTFRDGTHESGLTAASVPYTGFGTVLCDLDHDGDEDLVVVNGRVTHADAPHPRARLEAHWSFFAEPNQCFLNRGDGRFEDASARCGALAETVEISRGLAAADLDADGDLDLVVTNTRGPARLYENVAGSGGGAWLAVRAVEGQPPRDAVGARLAVRAGERTFRRTVRSSSSYMTSSLAPAHVGLGAVERYDGIEVTWPGGEREAFPGGEARGRVTLVRGAGRAIEASRR